jgi:serine/threonine-protein kinase
MIGKTIGKYRIVGHLGRGGMGTVYKAIDDTLDREVAIKVLNPGLAETEIIARFRREAITVAKLSHPEIATIYELFRSESDLLMVMEFVRGETLDRISQRRGALPPEHVAYVIEKILSALEHAHRAGIVHCDMKPANVMVTVQGGVKIMDFGIARVRGVEHATADGQLMGTPAYMPPEQVLGQQVDARSDLYSVGIICYRLLTGVLPFKADTAIAMVQKQISAEPMPLHENREGLPDWCEPVLRRALAKSPADRFQTAEEFRETLAAATGVLKPEVARTFFSSTVDVEAAAASQPGELERFGLTRVWNAGPERPVAPPESVGRTPQISHATLVLPGRRFTRSGPLLAVVAAAIAAIAVLAPWRGSVAPISGAGDLPLAAAVNPGPETAEPSVAKNVAAPAAEGSAGQSPVAISRPADETAPRFTSGAAAGPALQQLTSSNGLAVASASPGDAATSSAAAVGTAPVSDEAPVIAAPAPPDLPLTTAASGKPRAVPYVFEALALIYEGDRPKERESQVFLVDGRINVKANDDDTVLYTLPFNGVLSISYSRGRDPLWSGPVGPTPVTRAGRGLGIFRGTRHWVSLRIRNADAEFLVLRLGNGDRASSAIAALEERTGRTTTMLAENANEN